MKRRSAVRLGKYEESDWRAKVDPFFLRLVAHWNGILQLQYSTSSEDRHTAEELKQNFPPELAEEFQRQFKKRKEENHPFIEPMLTLVGLSGLPSDTVLPREALKFYLICVLRTGVTYPVLNAKAEGGDVVSRKKLLRVKELYYDVISGKKAFDRLRFKWDMHHVDLLTNGLSYGVATLNANELSDCFDNICLCGKVHLPDNLKKLRQRILRRLKVKL
jgi:hypothetical protein